MRRREWRTRINKVGLVALVALLIMHTGSIGCKLQCTLVALVAMHNDEGQRGIHPVYESSDSFLVYH